MCNAVQCVWREGCADTRRCKEAGHCTRGVPKEMEASRTSNRMSPEEACRAILELCAGWDANGPTGPKAPLRWETVACMAFDYARAAVRGSVETTTEHDVWCPMGSPSLTCTCAERRSVVEPAEERRCVCGAWKLPGDTVRLETATSVHRADSPCYSAEKASGNKVRHSTSDVCGDQTCHICYPENVV